MFSKYIQLLMLNKEMVTFAWLEVTFFRVSRKVSNNPELTFNWVDYFKRSNQMYVLPLVAFILFEQELVWKMQHWETKGLGRLL